MQENHLPTQAAGLQSMLKTTTETGDLGLLSMKSSRPLPRTSRDAHREYENLQRLNALGPRKYSSDHRGELRGPPNVHGYYRAPSSTSESGRFKDSPHHHLANSDGYSYRTSGSASSRPAIRPKQSLASPRSYSTLRSHEGSGTGDPMPRPWTPYSQSSYGHLANYRTSSPSVSDSEWITEHGASVVGRGPSVRTLPAPSSQHQMTLPFRPRREQSHSVRSQPTYGPSMNGHSIERRLSPRQVLRAMPNGLPPRTPSPLYYDYTEDFEEQNYETANESMSSLPAAETEASLDQRVLSDVVTGNARQEKTASTAVVDGFEMLPRNSQSTLQAWDASDRPLSALIEVEPSRSENLRKGGVSHQRHSSSSSHQLSRPTEKRPQGSVETLASLNGHSSRISALSERAKELPNYNTYATAVACPYPPQEVHSSQAAARRGDASSGADDEGAFVNLPVLTANHRPSADQHSGSDRHSGGHGQLQVHSPKPERPVSSESYRMRFSHLFYVDSMYEDPPEGGIEARIVTASHGRLPEHRKVSETQSSSSTDAHASQEAQPGRRMAVHDHAYTESNSPKSRPDLSRLQPPLSPTGYNVKPSQIVELGRIAAAKEKQSINGVLKTQPSADGPARPETSSTNATETARVLKLKASFPWLANELTFFAGDSSVSLALSNPSVSAKQPFSFVSSGLNTALTAEDDETESQRASRETAATRDKNSKIRIPPKFKLKMRRRVNSALGYLERNITNSDSSSRKLLTGSDDASAAGIIPEKPPKFKLKVRRPSKTWKRSTHDSLDRDAAQSTGAAEPVMSGGRGEPSRRTFSEVIPTFGRNATPRAALPSCSPAPPNRNRTPSTPAVENHSTSSRATRQAETRSFFSDNSSQLNEPRSSLRKRISALRSRLPGPKSGSTTTLGESNAGEEARGVKQRAGNEVKAGARTGNVGGSSTQVAVGGGGEQSRHFKGVLKGWMGVVRRKIIAAKGRIARRGGSREGRVEVGAEARAA